MANNIRYIEDNPDNMLLVQGVLAARGYNLPGAENCMQRLTMAEKEEVDLILLDINLPDMDGYEVRRRLQSSSKDALAHMPINAMPSNALGGDAEKALEAGYDVYMSKPINVHELRTRIGALAHFPE
jgi:two-component system cell cycle response regulator DivK